MITQTEYRFLDQAYQDLNRELFQGALPDLLITLQDRGQKTCAYYAPRRFASRAKTGERLDELALNPKWFAVATDLEILQALAHEAAHCRRQHLEGVKPPTGGYHDRKWAEIMEGIGLMPSATGAPGGKRTGRNMSDYIIPGGRFEAVARTIIENGFRVNWQEAVEMIVQGEDGQLTTAPIPKPKISKVKYTCPTCGGNAWAKPGRKLKCGEDACEAALMLPQPAKKSTLGIKQGDPFDGHPADQPAALEQIA